MIINHKASSGNKNTNNTNNSYYFLLKGSIIDDVLVIESEDLVHLDIYDSLYRELCTILRLYETEPSIEFSRLVFKKIDKRKNSKISVPSFSSKE